MLKYVLNKKGIECIGKSKKLKFKNATKINIIVDNNGIILAVKIYPANKNDSTITKDTIDSMSIKTISSRKFPKYLIGDPKGIFYKSFTFVKFKGYTSKDVKNRIKKKFKLVYPEKKNTVNSVYNSNQKILNKQLLSTRNVNENTFAWMKECKRLTSRYDRLLSTFTGFVFLQVIKTIACKLDNMGIHIM